MVSVESSVLELEETGEFIEVRLNRPEKRNAINVELLDSLLNVFNTLAEEDPQGVLLTGRGSITCAGADREAVLATPEPNLTKRFHELHHTVHTYPGATVMACKGAAIGAGFQLAVACDFAILGEGTIFSKPEIEYGLTQPYSVEMIAHIMSPQVAKEVNLVGTPIEPERARELGLAFDVVAPDEVETVAEDLLQRLLEYDVDVYAAIKEMVTFDTHPDTYERYY